MDHSSVSATETSASLPSLPSFRRLLRHNCFDCQSATIRVSLARLILFDRAVLGLPSQVRGIGYYHEGGYTQADALVALAKESIAAGALGKGYLEPAIAFFDDCQRSAAGYGYEGEGMNFFGRISAALRGK